MELSIKQVEKISKALGDANRLKILRHIAGKGGCGHCAEIQEVIDLAQPSVSHHIKTLIEAGLIEAEKEGRNYKYTINEEIVRHYIQVVRHITGVELVK
jgi:ArsR family transcriptional regulator